MIILSRYPSPYWTSPPGWLISQSMVSRGLRSSAFRFQRGIPHLFINWKSMGARILYTSNCRSHSMSHLIHNCSKLRLLAHTHSSLQKLSLGDCRELLFHKEGLPSNLRELQICRCNQLTSQVDWDLQRLSSLTHFTIFGRCEDVELFPKSACCPLLWLIFQSQIFQISSLLTTRGFNTLSLSKNYEYRTAQVSNPWQDLLFNTLSLSKNYKSTRAQGSNPWQKQVFTTSPLLKP